MLQALAWPGSVAFCVWQLTRAYEAHSRLMAAQYMDASLAMTASKSDEALRLVKKARDDWETNAAQTTEELSSLKNALMNR